MRDKRGAMTDAYYIGLVVIFIVGGGFALIKLSGAYNLENQDEGIGFRQSAVLGSYQQMDEIMLSIMSSAKGASSEAFFQLCKAGMAGTLSEKDIGCGLVGTQPLWNNASRRCINNSVVYSNYYSHLSDAFGRLWASRVLSFPPSFSWSYEFETNGPVLYGFANDDITIPILGLKDTPTSQLHRVFTGDGSYTWPSPYHRITSCYGNRVLNGKKDYHDGIDISMPGNIDEGAPVFAIADGIINHTCNDYVGTCACSLMESSCLNTCGRLCHGYGNNIIVKHNDNLFTRYSHLKDVLVQPGDVVVGGTQIATLGNTGYSSGAHLDFKVFTSREDAFDVDKGRNPFCFFDDATLSKVEIADSHCDAYAKPLTRGDTLLTDKYCDGIEVTRSRPACMGSTSPVVGHGDSSAGVEATRKNLEKYSKELKVNILELVKQAAEQYKVDPGLLLGQITHESKGNVFAVNPSGDSGLAQFSPSTAKDNKILVNVDMDCKCSGSGCHDIRTKSGTSCSLSDDRFNPEKITLAQAEYMSRLLKKFEKYSYGVYFAVGSYNAGSGNFDDLIAATGKSDPSWEEVMAALNTYSGISGSNKKIIRDYAPSIIANAQEWGSDIPTAFSCAGGEIESKDLGSLTFTPSFSVPVKDFMSTAINLLSWSKDVSSVDDNLNQAFDDEIADAKKMGWDVSLSFCPVDELENFLNVMLLRLNECVLNGQDSCTCRFLPEVLPRTGGCGDVVVEAGIDSGKLKDGSYGYCSADERCDARDDANYQNIGQGFGCLESGSDPYCCYRKTGNRNVPVEGLRAIQQNVEVGDVGLQNGKYSAQFTDEGVVRLRRLGDKPAETLAIGPPITLFVDNNNHEFALQEILFNFSVRDGNIVDTSHSTIFAPDSRIPVHTLEFEKEFGEVYRFNENVLGIFDNENTTACLPVRRLVPVCAESDHLVMNPGGALVNPKTAFGVLLTDTNPPPPISGARLEADLFGQLSFSFTLPDIEDLSGILLACTDNGDFDNAELVRIPAEELESSMSIPISECNHKTIMQTPGQTYWVRAHTFDYGGNENIDDAVGQTMASFIFTDEYLGALGGANLMANLI